MSDTPILELTADEISEPAPDTRKDAAVPVCPITSEFLPPNLRKHVDPKAPLPLRGMTAKGLVPFPSSDMCGALFILTFDPDPKIRETARQTAAELPERLLNPALRDEGLAPPVLAFLLELFWEKDAYAEALIINASTPDEAVAAIAPRCSGRLAELIGQNQLRLLRHDDVIRGLCENPHASGALIDRVCDFAVRSGVILDDVEQMRDARVRIYGPEILEKEPEPVTTAESVVEEFGSALLDENPPPMEEGRRLNMTQTIMKMSITQKIKLATLGNKEARSLLIRDSNKLVATAVIRSPRITDGEVLAIANNRSVNDDVLRIIYNKRDWTKVYPVKLALVKNPKTPPGVSMKFLSTLRQSDLKELSRSKNIPSGVQSHAKKMLTRKGPGQD